MAMATEVKNCLTCRTGRRWWMGNSDGSFKCPVCHGNPLIGDGRRDWSDFMRARMVARFGPRIQGDAELLSKYRDEVAPYG